MGGISIAEYRALLERPGNRHGELRKKRDTPEDDLQRACIEWAELHVAKYPLLAWLTHVPNGGKRPPGEAGKLKGLGVKKGFPDLMLPLSSSKWKGLVVEMKSPTGKTSKEQAEWLDVLAKDGWKVDVCRSIDDFITIINLFLDVKNVHE